MTHRPPRGPTRLPHIDSITQPSPPTFLSISAPLAPPRPPRPPRSPLRQSPRVTYDATAPPRRLAPRPAAAAADTDATSPLSEVAAVNVYSLYSDPVFHAQHHHDSEAQAQPPPAYQRQETKAPYAPSYASDSGSDTSSQRSQRTPSPPPQATVRASPGNRTPSPHHALHAPAPTYPETQRVAPAPLFRPRRPEKSRQQGRYPAFPPRS